MFQWSGAVYSTFAGYFLFFFVSILYMLICEANGWTGFGVMGFYRKVVPNRKWSFICMGLEKILQSSGLLFYHKRKWFQGPCPISRFRWRRFPGTVSDVLHHQRVAVCFYTLVQVRLSDVKKIPYHSNNLTLELASWRFSIKRRESLSSKKYIYIYIYIFILYIYIYIYI